MQNSQMPLGVQPKQMLLQSRASLLQAAVPRGPKPLTEPSPGEGQYPCALLQQRRVSLCPSSGSKPLMVPAKASRVPQLQSARCGGGGPGSCQLGEGVRS